MPVHPPAWLQGLFDSLFYASKRMIFINNRARALQHAWRLHSVSRAVRIVGPKRHLVVERCVVCAPMQGKGQIDLSSGMLHLGFAVPGFPQQHSGLKIGLNASVTALGKFKFFTGHSISLADGAQLTVGSGYMNVRGVIDCFDAISIGHDVAIGPDVVIRDSDNHRLEGQARVTAPVTISDHVWIGQRAMILKGVTVGTGAVIAAGTVVSGDVPPNTLVAGVPARVIRENVNWA